MRQKVLCFTKRIIAAIVITTMFFAMCKQLEYWTNDDSSSYARIMFHEFYNQETIDNLYAGASLMFRSFNPEIMDRELRCNNFDAGTSGQELDTTALIIEEALSTYDVKHVYLELSFVMANRFNIENRKTVGINSVYAATDNMKSSFRKANYLLNASTSDFYANSFLIGKRNWKSLFNADLMRTIGERKRSDIYKDYKPDYANYPPAGIYIGKGYLTTDDTVAIKEHSFNDDWGAGNYTLSRVTVEWYDVLNKIINDCENANVDLTFVCSPLSDYFIYNCGEYSAYHDSIKKIASENDIDFWDFNYCNERYFSYDSELYLDGVHLNAKGSEVFTNLFCDIVNGQLDAEDVLNSTIESRLERLGPYLIGVSTNGYEVTIDATEPSEFEFQIVMVGEDGKEDVIREYSSNLMFTLPENKNGEYRVRGRNIHALNEIQEGVFLY